MSTRQKTARTGQRRGGVGTGTTSLLMIFTVLCFATLAMLSLSTAAGNWRIQQQGLAGSTATAHARGQVAEKVATLDAALLQLADGHTGSEADYLAAALAAAAKDGWETDEETYSVVLCLPTSGERELVTRLRLLGPGQAQRYTVLAQFTQPTGGWQPETGGQLWQG